MTKVCEICGKNDATIHVRQIYGNGEKISDYCIPCALKIGLTRNKNDAPPMNMFNDFFNLIMKNRRTKSDKSRNADIPVRKYPCPSCGMRPQNAIKGDVLGCVTCLEHNRDFWLNKLKPQKKLLQHIGRVPKRYLLQYRMVDYRGYLEENLDNAIAGENYEEASRLRDRLNELLVDNGS